MIIKMVYGKFTGWYESGEISSITKTIKEMENGLPFMKMDKKWYKNGKVD